MRLRTKFAALAVTAGVAVTATAGYAYFTTTGSGSGSASVGTDTGWAVTSDAAQGGPLTPGGPSQTVGYHVKNNSTGHQKLQNVTVAVKNADGSGWTAVTGCSADDFTVSIENFVATDLDAGATYNGTAKISMNNLGADQNACRLASVPLYFSAS